MNARKRADARARKRGKSNEVLDSSDSLSPSTKKKTLVGIILLSVALCLTASFVAGLIQYTTLDTKANSAMSTLKRQCETYDKLVTQEKTKSLFRLSDLLNDLRSDLTQNPAQVNDDYLSSYVDNLRVSGVSVLNDSLELDASGHTRQYSGNPSWMGTIDPAIFREMISHPQKTYLERITVSGKVYDVCAVGRYDQPGVIVGFYEQSTGLINDTENDLASLIGGLDLDQDGRYIVSSNGVIRAASNSALLNSTAEADEALAALSQIEKSDHLSWGIYKGTPLWIMKSGQENYVLYLFYPFINTLISGLVVGIILAAFFFFACSMYVTMRNRTLFQSHRELEQSNRRLTETVHMLESLETIYFFIARIDLKEDSYQIIHLAPWLEPYIADAGTCTNLKKFLTGIALEEYREDVGAHISDAFVAQTLNKNNISEGRKSFYFDYQAMRGSEPRWCRLQITVADYDAEGVPERILALVQDIDKEKLREAAYQKRILEEAHQAKVANAAKTEFLRRISHDVRTPINGIQGYIDLGSKHPEDLALQQHCRESATVALTTLLELVNSILTMSKLETEEVVLDCEPFNLRELLDRGNTVILPQAISRNIEYRVDTNEQLSFLHLIGSPRHVHQILLNLATNAVKYGKPGGYVRVGATLVSNTSTTATYDFFCEDNGIGMSEEFQAHLFEPFAQENPGARSTYEGMGLGLSIVKKLVDALGGTITCTSKAGEGTTFHVQLTFEVDPHYQQEASHDDAADESDDLLPLHGLNILLAEDNELNMDIATCLLTEWGATVTQAWNGQEAVERFAAAEGMGGTGGAGTGAGAAADDAGADAATNGTNETSAGASPTASTTGTAAKPFDVVLMDIMMPQMNGLQAASAIRQLNTPHAKTTPIIAMSANAFPDDVQASLDAGMNGHLPKPISADDVLKTILGSVARV